MSTATSASARDLPADDPAFDGARFAERRTRTALAVLLVLMLVLAVIGLVAVERLYQSSQRHYVNEALPLRSQSRDLLLQLVNEETGVRGYLITGDPMSLDPYMRAQPRAQADLAGLDGLARRRPEIAGEVVNLRRQVERLNLYFDSQIALVQAGPAGRRQAQSNVFDGKELFDHFRATAGSLLVSSEAILRDAERAQHRTYRGTLAAIVGVAGGAAAIGLGLLFVVPRRMRSLYRREEDARRAAERGERASRSLAHVDDAVVLLDEDDIVRYLNPAAARSLGVPEELALNHPARDVVSGFDDVLLAAETGGLVRIEVDRGERWFAAIQSRFAEGSVLVLRDLTAERELDRARSEFIATASHELRTPLASVYGAVRTLRRADFPDSPHLSAALLKMIEDEASRLNVLVERLLTSAELDRSQLRLDRRECELRELCESVIASTEQRSPGAELILDAPDRVTIECDPQRLRQVLVNLVDNAVKYSGPGSRTQITIRERAHDVEIAVEDHGIGIGEEALGRVFDKFYRADPHMIGGVGGSGLGLYISRELVERMGGRLSLVSQIGTGSTFTIVLPVEPGSVVRRESGPR